MAKLSKRSSKLALCFGAIAMAVLVASSALTMLPASKPSTMKLNDENSNASVDMATADLGYLLSYNKIATSITLFNEIPVVQLDSNVHIDGQLSGMAWTQGTTIRLHILCPDGSIDVPVQGKFVTADSSGKFSFDYVPTSVGNYTALAIFAGTNRYSQASGNVQFEVHEENVVNVVKAHPT